MIRRRKKRRPAAETIDAVTACSCTSNRRALSLAGATRSAREQLPHCELTDDELAYLIAWQAVRHGTGAVIFDRSIRRQPIEEPVH